MLLKQGLQTYMRKTGLYESKTAFLFGVCSMWEKTLREQGDLEQAEKLFLQGLCDNEHAMDLTPYLPKGVNLPWKIELIFIFLSFKELKIPTFYKISNH